MMHPLLAYRQKHKLTMQQVAERYGVNRTSVMRWELGQISKSRAEQLSKDFKIPLKKLRQK